MTANDTESWRHQAELMVKHQIAARDIEDERVMQAMREVPRHLFVPEPYRSRAYEDAALPVAAGQTISQPYMVALMTSLLRVQPGLRVLEIGAGSGYQAAVLAQIGAEVITVERLSELADRARTAIQQVDLAERVTVVEGDGTLGYPDAGPYERVLVTAGGPSVPPALTDQLADGGRIVVPVGDRSGQMLMVYDKRQGELEPQQSVPCRFVPLIGQQGWQDERAGL